LQSLFRCPICAGVHLLKNGTLVPKVLSDFLAERIQQAGNSVRVLSKPMHHANSVYQFDQLAVLPVEFWVPDGECVAPFEWIVIAHGGTRSQA
jgi:hypothetical protein